MDTRKRIRFIAGNGILCALAIVFTLISNYIQIGPVSINLSLVPISVAAILYGPLSGFIVGLINGGFVMLAPSTAAFFSLSIVGTILTCLLKSSLAGLIAGLLYKLIKKKNDTVAMISSFAITPILNSAIFIIFALIFFQKGFGELISIFISINFAIEFVSTIALSFALVKVLQHTLHKEDNIKNQSN